MNHISAAGNTKAISRDYGLSLQQRDGGGGSEYEFYMITKRINLILSCNYHPSISIRQNLFDL